MQSPQNLMPYTCSSQRAYIQSGFQRSLSGSDTDISTSTENLTPEEKNVLQNGVRQEPQGEETIIGDSDTVPSNTLIIHSNTLVDDYNSPFYGLSCNKGKKFDTHNLHYLNQDFIDSEKHLINYPQQCRSSDINPIMHSSSLLSKGSSNSNVTPLKSPNRTTYCGLHKPPLHNAVPQCNNDFLRNNRSPTQLLSPSSSMFYPTSPVKAFSEHPVQEITDIPEHYLDQSEVLKHLAKEMNHQPSPLELNSMPPPPDYPRWRISDRLNKPESNFGALVRIDGVGMGISTNITKSSERLSVSRSHPDLTHVGKNCHIDDNCDKLSQLIQRPETRGRASTDVSSEAAAHQISQMFELLSVENASLKSELDLCYRKVSKLQKFELEIQKVHQAHEDLVRSSEKREKLERAVRLRLEMDIRRVQEHNKELRDHLESATSHFCKRSLADIDDSDLRKELSKREVLVAQLLTQNKELMAEKERQEIELQAQRATLQEQRNHINILDNALTNAQTNVVKLEDESRKKQVYVERVSQLQKALANLQLASERRLQMEKKVRSQLENELDTLKSQKRGEQSTSMSHHSDTVSVEDLKKYILEYEEKVIALEAEVTRWEQRYIEESTMRQIAVDAASVPKDAKIAALEKTSQESEKLIAQARTEKLKHMDELYAANRKCTELEGRIKDFESKLAEKDAMIKVLQQHSQEKDAVLQHAVLGRPPRHARAASTVGLSTSTSHTTTTTGVASLGRASPSPSMLHCRSGSRSDLCTSNSVLSASGEVSNPSLPSTSSSVTESVTATQKSLDEQLKELDSRLSSKDSIISALRAEKERYPSHFWRV